MTLPVKLFKLREIAEQERVDYDTVYRWVTQGCGGVRLVAHKLGKQWFVREEDLETFRRECTGNRETERPEARRAKKRKPGGTRQSRAEASRKRLEAMGL